MKWGVGVILFIYDIVCICIFSLLFYDFLKIFIFLNYGGYELNVFILFIIILDIEMLLEVKVKVKLFEMFFFFYFVNMGL